jgi:hypothetical protein
MTVLGALDVTLKWGGSIVTPGQFAGLKANQRCLEVDEWYQFLAWR